MGRYSWSGRPTVEDALVLDIFWLNKQGYLRVPWTGTLSWKRGSTVSGNISIRISVVHGYNPGGSIAIEYSVSQDPEGVRTSLAYTVTLLTTRCNYGKYRWWFVCPGVGCQKRVGKLYLPPAAQYFACRTCYDMTYESCRESHNSVYRLAHAHGLTLRQFERLIADKS